MQFELIVTRNVPLTSVDDFDEALEALLFQVGYLPRKMEARRGTKALRESAPYKLVADCLLARPEKAWTPEELAMALKTSKVTVYRHLGKLRGMDLIEEAVADPRRRKRGFRIRYGSLAKAWNFVEANVDVAMQNYRKSVEHVEELARKARRK
jgi:DNA-binding transcriptional ArsR family regulator